MTPSCATHGCLLDNNGLCIREECEVPHLTYDAQAYTARDAQHRIDRMAEGLHTGGSAGDLEGAAEVLVIDLELGGAAFRACETLRDVAAAARLLDRYPANTANTRFLRLVADACLRTAREDLKRWETRLEPALARRRAAGAE